MVSFMTCFKTFCIVFITVPLTMIFNLHSSKLTSLYLSKIRSNSPSLIKCPITSSIRLRLHSSTRSISLPQKYLPRKHSPVCLFFAASVCMFLYVKNDAIHLDLSSNVTITSVLSSFISHCPSAHSSASIQIEYCFDIIKNHLIYSQFKYTICWIN